MDQVVVMFSAWSAPPATNQYTRRTKRLQHRPRKTLAIRPLSRVHGHGVRCRMAVLLAWGAAVDVNVGVGGWDSPLDRDEPGGTSDSVEVSILNPPGFKLRLVVTPSALVPLPPPPSPVYRYPPIPVSAGAIVIVLLPTMRMELLVPAPIAVPVPAHGNAADGYGWTVREEGGATDNYKG